LRVSLLERLEQLYAIGGGPGANRLGGSAHEDEAHELVAGWMRDSGLEVERDEAGNLYGRLRGRRPELTEVWTGSHLDTVPAGGRFDGALGVVGGLGAVERAGQQERTLAVVAFRDEEGCSGPGCLGSRALCAALPDPSPAAFVELHIEQGPRLEEAGAPLAVVTAIAATAKGEVVFEGREGHAGTTPMAGRSDALVAAAEFVLVLRDAAAAVDEAVATVGRLEVEPGASNVIAARARVSVDVRAPDLDRVDQVVAVVPAELSRTAEVEMTPELVEVLREQLAGLGVPVLDLASGAGHDAGILAAAGVPTGMLFVRSLNGGISHSPDELTAPEDIALALTALEGLLRLLAGSVDE
jgi:acetylornithine deacetylase/succinyl-diaminopimelate desuccinylase-like protein